MCIYTDYYRRENCMNNYMRALLAKLYFIRLLNDNNVINYILIFPFLQEEILIPSYALDHFYS